MRWIPAMAFFLGGMPAAALTVDADFEGASVKVLHVDAAGQRLRVTPGGDAERGWPCWWFFRVNGLDAGRPLLLELEASPEALPATGKPLASGWAMPRRASYSHDGVVWHHTESGSLTDGRMIYEVPTGKAGSMLVAWGPPYTVSQAAGRLAELAAEHAGAELRELVLSRGGRPVTMLRVCEGDKVEARRPAVWVQARQHAWECGSSWAAEGFAEWVLSVAGEAAWLRQHADVYIVPVMDVDNIGTGQGGKDARPWDHNRDWSDKPHWPEVAAAQRFLLELVKEGRMAVFLDLHNPAPGDKEVFFFAGDVIRPGEESFMERVFTHMQGVMPMRQEPRRMGRLYSPLWQRISRNWVAAQAPEHTISLCLEIPWNTEHSTADGYKRAGAALARAVQEHLESRP